MAQLPRPSSTLPLFYRQTKLLTDLTNSQAVCTRLDKQAEDIEARFLCQCGQGG